jgi:L,D-peptidoglycan transpeptidase YkuD (ErfK/YbiS/YcfS/YnhG family)
MNCRVAAVVLGVLMVPTLAYGQACPAALRDATRLVLVTTDTMDSTPATAQLFDRASAKDAWRALGEAEPAVVGRAGIAWAQSFRQFAKTREPIKIEGDKRAPAGVYPIGKTFGTEPSSRPGHLKITEDTVCVDDPDSPEYNKITSRAVVGPKVHAENMSRASPMYRHGLLVDYPTDIAAKAGSCIFIHVWRAPTRGTAGCVALPEERVLALQDFAASGGAVLAVLPRFALPRLRGCLPFTAAASR